MQIHQRIARGTAAIATLATLTACSGGGGALGDILGSVLTPQSQQVAGTIRGVDTRAQQISLQQSNGQTVGIGYDANTKVVYQNRVYAVTNLENGDQVSARVQTGNNNTYYTDSIHVTASVSGTGGTTGSGEVVQQLQGTVRQVDRTNGWFTLDAGSGVIITVSMPYRPSTTDANRFQNLRTGDNVRILGVYLNASRVELRQFY